MLSRFEIGRNIGLKNPPEMTPAWLLSLRYAAAAGKMSCAAITLFLLHGDAKRRRNRRHG